jgi:hypothetical protein
VEPELALAGCRQRTKVEGSLRKLKGLLGLGKVMNEKREEHGEDGGPSAPDLPMPSSVMARCW